MDTGIRWLVWLGLLAALLAGCGGAPAAEAPVPTPTVVSLDKVDIEPVLIQSGDLASQVAGGQVKELVPILFKGITEPSRVLTQELDRNGVPFGSVTVFLYNSAKERESAYTEMLRAIAIKAESGGASQAGIGEQSFGGVFANNLPGFAEIVFVRCHAAVHIRINSSDATDVTTYAKRLDKRLESLVC
jgi:hypothetical protein